MRRWVAVEFPCSEEDDEAVVDQIKDRLASLEGVEVHDEVVDAPAPFYLWQCRECGEKAHWGIYDCESAGLPVCPECGEDMELVK